MSRSSQRGSAPGPSRFVTPPRDPEAVPVFVTSVNSEHEDNQAGGSSAPHALLPGDLKVPDASPRKITISSIDLLHKQKGQYTKVANMEMEHRYAKVTLDTFFDDYVPKLPKDSELSESQLKKSGNFSKVSHSNGETMMYAPLVRVSASHFHPF